MRVYFAPHKELPQPQPSSRSTSINIPDSQNQLATPHYLDSLIGTLSPAMVPSEDDIAKFIAFAPDADEGQAFVFLEVRDPDAL